VLNHGVKEKKKPLIQSIVLETRGGESAAVSPRPSKTRTNSNIDRESTKSKLEHVMQVPYALGRSSALLERDEETSGSP